jgi:hypothetical protein
VSLALLLEVSHVFKTYTDANRSLTVLNDISFWRESIESPSPENSGFFKSFPGGRL